MLGSESCRSSKEAGQVGLGVREAALRREECEPRSTWTHRGGGDSGEGWPWALFRVSRWRGGGA